MKIEVSLDEYINSIVNEYIIEGLKQMNNEIDIPKRTLEKSINFALENMQPLIDDLKCRVLNGYIPRGRL